MSFSEGSTPNHEKNYRNTKKYVSSEKNPKNCMRATRRNLPIPIEMKKIPKKSMFRTPKVKRSQKFLWELPDGIFPGSLKNNRTQV
jgi:hypothetical protein